MSDKTALGDRMKSQYESRTKQFLIRRMPTIIRLDGKSFSKWTKGLAKPFDEGLIEDMQQTTKFLCENIQGCKLGYTQSDEITLVLTDYDDLNTEMWFDGNVQKITSISASLATAKFNELRTKRLHKEVDIYYDQKGVSTLAFFDSRVFQIPEKEEVVNCLIWRQRDAEKNSVSMLAQSLYSHTELHKKNSSDKQEMCFQKGHNWNDLHWSKKRGSFLVKNTYVNGVNLYTGRDTIELGDMWYQPLKQSVVYPDPRGRVLQFAEDELGFNSWCDVPIESIRYVWEVVETPIFSKDRDSILKLI